jgi:hypothetical protein
MRSIEIRQLATGLGESGALRHIRSSVRCAGGRNADTLRALGSAIDTGVP